MSWCFCGKKRANLRQVSQKKSANFIIETQNQSPVHRSPKSKEQYYQEDSDLQSKLSLIRAQLHRYSEEVLKTQHKLIKPDINFSQPEEFPLYKYENGKFFYYANTLIV